MESAQRFHMKSRVRFKFPTLCMGIKFPNPWKTLIIKFPPPQDSKGVKCPGYARGGGGAGMLKLWFDQYIYVHALLIQYSCRKTEILIFLKKTILKRIWGCSKCTWKSNFIHSVSRKPLQSWSLLPLGSGDETSDGQMVLPRTAKQCKNNN